MSASVTFAGVGVVPSTKLSLGARYEQIAAGAARTALSDAGIDLGLVQHLGTIGRLNEDGHLHLSDRLDDVTFAGGVTFYPAAIEAPLVELDTVGTSSSLASGKMPRRVVLGPDGPRQDSGTHVTRRLRTACWPAG